MVAATLAGAIQCPPPSLRTAPLLKSCRKRRRKVIEGAGSIGMRSGSQIQHFPVQFNAHLQVRELPLLLKSCRKRISKVIEGAGSIGMTSGSEMERSSHITDDLSQVDHPACLFTQFQRISSVFKELAPHGPDDKFPAGPDDVCRRMDKRPM